MADGAFSFVSWVRRGLATGIDTNEGEQVGATYSPALVELQFNGETSDANAKAPLRLVSPGDIVGLDSNVICRTWPHANDMDAEYIPYPLIEFDQADLPWRYTPLRADPDAVSSATDKLRPWFSLVVLDTSECSVAAPTPEQKLAVLTVNDVTSLDPIKENLWAWAHTQFEGSDIAPDQPDAANTKITGSPGLFTARVMSPRLLQPNTEYFACLVPTFERGRRIGLGIELDDSIDASTGWSQTSGAFQLPVYYYWRFRTGTVGDFEQVARLIKPYELPDTLGFRDMDVREAGFDLPPATDIDIATNQNAPLPIEGALMSIAAADKAVTWPDTNGAAFIQDLTAFINAWADPNDPILAPPLYGQWYAAQTQLTDPTSSGGNSPWFWQLNTDPRNRVAAALGTKVIQREQQALLAAGWDQVEELPFVNEYLRVLQLTRQLLVQLYVRHFKTHHLQYLYQLTARLHAEVTCGDNTVCYNLGSSPIVSGFFAAQWLRWVRPYGAIGRIQGRPTNAFTPNLIEQLNDCSKPATDPERPGSISTVTTSVVCDYIEELVGLGSEVLLRWGLLILWTSRNLLVQRNGECWWLGLKALRVAIGFIQIAISGTDATRRCRAITFTTTVQDIVDTPPQGAEFTDTLPVGDTIALPSLPGGTITTDSSTAAEIRAGLVDVFTDFQAPEALECPPGIDLQDCYTSLIASIDPEVTVVDSVTDSFHFDDRLLWKNSTDQLQPRFAQPSFERPMYEPLAAISSDWMLPGLNSLPRNTAGLALVNQRFIEAYMTGLNHEMTRELLWNEFPTDQRGTYFRQFWDLAGCSVSSPVPPENMRDIKPFRLWDPIASLGQNSTRPIAINNQAFIVLVVRAQLIEKYPNVIVYAQRVENGSFVANTRTDPIFYALLKPDTAFYGFAMTEQDLRSANGNQVWYFVLEEQPGDPKFSDPADDGTGSLHTAGGYTQPSSSLGTSSGIIGQNTFLQPFRLGIQASTMLPQPTP